MGEQGEGGAPRQHHEPVQVRVARTLVLVRPQATHALEGADGVELEPLAIDGRDSTGTHLLFGTPWMSVYQPNT